MHTGLPTKDKRTKTTVDQIFILTNYVHRSIYAVPCLYVCNIIPKVYHEDCKHKFKGPTNL